MFTNVAPVAYAVAAVTLLTAGSTVAVSIRSFESLFAEAFLGSYFANLLPFARASHFYRRSHVRDMGSCASRVRPLDIRSDATRVRSGWFPSKRATRGVYKAHKQ